MPFWQARLLLLQPQDHRVSECTVTGSRPSSLPKVLLGALQGPRGLQIFLEGLPLQARSLRIREEVQPLSAWNSLPSSLLPQPYSGPDLQGPEPGALWPTQHPAAPVLSVRTEREQQLGQGNDWGNSKMMLSERNQTHMYPHHVILISKNLKRPKLSDLRVRE